MGFLYSVIFSPLIQSKSWPKWALEHSQKLRLYNFNFKRTEKCQDYCTYRFIQRWKWLAHFILYLCFKSMIWPDFLMTRLPQTEARSLCWTPIIFEHTYSSCRCLCYNTTCSTNTSRVMGNVSDDVTDPPFTCPSWATTATVNETVREMRRGAVAVCKSLHAERTTVNNWADSWQDNNYTVHAAFSTLIMLMSASQQTGTNTSAVLPTRTNGRLLL